MKLNSKKFYYVLLIVLVLLIGLIIGGVIAGNVLLKRQGDKLSRLKIENKAIESQQTALFQAKKDLERYDELDKIARSVVPQDKDQAKTIREIVKIAAENKVPIKSFNFDASTLGATANTPGTTTGTQSAQSGGITQNTPQISQLKAVPGIPGVYSMEIRVESQGTVTYRNFLRFLEGLEKNRRTAHVVKILLEPDEKTNGEDLSFKLTITAYVKP